MEVSVARRLLGRSTRLWATDAGVTVHERGWAAMSGAHSVDYNLVLCLGDGDDLDAAVQRITDARVPAVLMVAGPTIGWVQRLVERSWVCIGSAPLMVRKLDAAGGRRRGLHHAATTAGQLDREQLPSLQDLVADVFDLPPGLSEVAMPERVVGDAGLSAWAAFEPGGRMASGLGTVRVDDAIAVWSMATRRDLRGHGYGAAALEAALVAAGKDGARACVLYASAEGEPFYRRVGFVELERWQMWSRPRWVLGRA